MSAELNSFVESIRPFSESGYEGLFAPSRKGAYPVYDDKLQRWAIQKLEPRDRVAYYDQIARYLITTKCYRDIPDLEAFVRRLNVCRTADFGGASGSSKAEHIFFNSKSTTHPFFSNFYPTLILFRDHQDPTLLRLYPSSENVYQAHKIARILDKQKEAPELHAEVSGENWDEFLEEVAVADPLKSKQLAASCIYMENSDWLAQMKYELMHEIVSEKFRLNPTLQQLLGQTGEKELIEDSSDLFWGSKNSHDPSLQRSYSLPIDMTSRNVLGRILMEIRRAL